MAHASCMGRGVSQPLPDRRQVQVAGTKSSADSVLPDTKSATGWFFHGCKTTLCVPALVFSTAMIGFAGFARELGIPLELAIIITVLMMALPNMAMIASALGTGIGLPAAAILVTLTAIRLMPLVVALTPLVATRTTPRWQLFAISHFVAITTWLYARAHLPPVPPHRRIAVFAGFGVTLTLANAMLVVACYLLIARLPPALAAALFFLAPLYFLLSLAHAARGVSDKLALVAGLVLAPPLHVLLPGADLLVAGIAGGTFAFMAARLIERRRTDMSP